MSLAGFHYSYAAKHNGLGLYLKTCADAGSPVPIVFSVNQDVATDCRKYSPSTVTVFRYQDGHGDKPNDDAVLGQGDPIQAGRTWFDKAAVKFALNPFHTFVSATNELNPDNEHDHFWAAQYWFAQMYRADELGYKTVWGNFSSGTPDYRFWPIYESCVRYATEHGHPLGLHEYGLDRGSMQNATPDLVLRYRKVYDIFRVQGWGWPLLIVSECAPGSNVSGAIDVSDAAWYDSQLMADHARGLPIVGAAFYNWGGPESQPFTEFAPGFFRHIAETPTPSIIPDDMVTGVIAVKRTEQAYITDLLNDNGVPVVWNE